MNTIRKLRPQPKLAHLSEEERNQIAESLKTDTYQTVLARIAKPRPDGFDTRVSVSVLQTLRERAALAEALSEQAEERLAVDDLLALLNGEPVPWHEVTLHLVQKAAFKLSLLQGQSAAMLLNLIRIANNPFHRQLAQEKLDLQKRSLALRETKIEQARAAKSQPKAAPSNPLKSLEGMQAHEIIRHFRPKLPPAPTKKEPASTDSDPLGGLTVAQFIQSIPPKPVAARRQTAADISPSTSDASPAHSSTNPAIHPSLRSPAQPQTENSSIPASDPPSDSTMQQLNDSTTAARRRDHMRRRVAWFIKPDRNNPVPRDDSWRLECPCGEHHPCPHHEALPDWVNDISPWSADFGEELRIRGIPCANPHGDLTSTDQTK